LFICRNYVSPCYLKTVPFAYRNLILETKARIA